MAYVMGSSPGQRLVVALEPADTCGRLHVRLTEQNHADGIGWFDQRSLRLDSRQWAQMRGLFADIERQFSAAEAHESPATIPFPSFMGDDPADDGLNQNVG
jgi:hypothetical protein